jgi:hypothetical protein
VAAACFRLRSSYAELEEFLSGPQHRPASALKLYGRSGSQGRSKSPNPTRNPISAWESRDHRGSVSPGRGRAQRTLRASASPRPRSASPPDHPGELSSSIHSLSEYLKQERRGFVSASDLKVNRFFHLCESVSSVTVTRRSLPCVDSRRCEESVA